MSDIDAIQAHRDRAQEAYDTLPLSGPVTSWCETYGEDLLDSCTALLAALKQRTDLIDAAAKHWLESCRMTSPAIPWEGAIDGAMEAACKEIERLRARVAELEKTLAEANEEADVREEEGDTLVGQIKVYVEHRHELARQNITLRKRVADLEAAQAWHPLPPEGINVRTKRDGEDGENVCYARHTEWVEVGFPHRTTVTHHSFAAPTHWSPIQAPKDGT